MEVAQTRSEVMTARAYGDDSDHAETSTKTVGSPPTSAPIMALVPEPRCAVCNSVIAADRIRAYPRTSTCGDRCSHIRSREKAKLRDRKWRKSRNVKR